VERLTLELLDLEADLIALRARQTTVKKMRNAG
jgi:hypothetical protein